MKERKSRVGVDMTEDEARQLGVDLRSGLSGSIDSELRLKKLGEMLLADEMGDDQRHFVTRMLNASMRQGIDTAAGLNDVEYAGQVRNVGRLGIAFLNGLLKD